MSVPATPSYDVLRELALRVGREGAVIAREMRRGGVEVAATKSSDVDVVTRADRAVEEHVVGALLAERPGDGILGEEESGNRPGTTGVRWVVDPIDGTVNYLYGLPDCAVSVAAEVEGRSVAAAVVGIGREVEYTAALGIGATRDGLPIRVAPAVPLSQRLVLTGFGYRADVRAHQAACVARLLPQVRDIRRMGSCALDLCHVADGSGDAYVEAGPQRWDWAAGSLVLAEAGGRFGLLPGRQVWTGMPRDNLVVGARADDWSEWVRVLQYTGFAIPGVE